MKQNNTIKMKIPTGVKLTGVELTEEFLQYKQKVDLLQRKFASLFNDWVVDELILSIDNKYIKFTEEVWDGDYAGKQQDKDVASLRHVKALPEVKEIIESVLSEDELENMQKSAMDDILWHVVERYKSYKNRNKKFPKNGIQIKSSKAMNFKDGKLKVDAENKTITIKSLKKNEEIILPFADSYYDNLDLVDNTWRGGNIVFNSLEARADNELVLMVEHEKEFYEPTHVIGMDVNMKDENWLTFSEEMENGGVTLAKPLNISEIEKVRDTLNAKLRPKKKDEVEYKLNSAQRRKMYRRLQKKMVNRYTAIEESLKSVLESFNQKYKEQLAFAIDGVATGRTKNSFGQEDVRDIVVRWCLKNEVPFVIVPPQYTSQRCPDCGEFHKQDRKTSNTYLCPSCGYFNENCDLVGAVNIKVHGEFLLEKFKFSAPSLSVKMEKMPLAAEFSVALREFFNFPDPKSKPQP